MVVAAPPAHPPQLAFVRSDDSSGAERTWIVNADGSELRPWHAGGSPVWSHDGRRVAYAQWHRTATGYRLTVYVENADSSGRHRIARINADRCFGASWSPDGSTLAFSTGCEVDDTSIWLAADRRNPRRVDRGLLCCVVPRWSPDGRALLAGAFGHLNTLLRIDLATGKQRRIPHTTFDSVRWFWTWTRGGQVDYVDRTYGLYTVNVDGSGWRQLSPASLRVNDFELSPDGQTIVFTGGDGRHRDIYVMPAGGGEATKLTDGVYDSEPTWSPDGSRIAFVRLLPPPPGTRYGDIHVFTMRADGSEQRDSGPSHADDSPSWIP